jgi:hypothetical protein
VQTSALVCALGSFSAAALLFTSSCQLISVEQLLSVPVQVYVVASQQLDNTPPVMVVKSNGRYDNAPLLSSSGQQLGTVTYITQGLTYVDAGECNLSASTSTSSCQSLVDSV